MSDGGTERGSPHAPTLQDAWALQIVTQLCLWSCPRFEPEKIDRKNRRPSATDQLPGLLPGRAQDVTDCIRHADRRIRPWLTGVHAGPGRAQNVHPERVGGTVSHRLLADLLGSYPGGERLGERDASILTSLAVLLITLANAAAGIRHVRRSALRAASLARWGFRTPRQETGAAKPGSGPSPE